MGQDGQHFDWSTLCRRAGECDLAFSLWFLSARETARRPFVAASGHHIDRDRRQSLDQSRDAEAGAGSWAGAMGKNLGSRHGGTVWAGRGLYMGDGSDGIHSLFGSSVLARE